MTQVLILEANEKSFLGHIDDRIKEGFKLIPGSTFIKSLPTNIHLDHGTMTTDVSHVFSAATTGDRDYMILGKTMSSFKNEINAKLALPNHHIVVGSTSIDLVCGSEYKHSDRVYLTYYCCALHKED